MHVTVGRRLSAGHRSATDRRNCVVGCRSTARTESVRFAARRNDATPDESGLAARHSALLDVAAADFATFRRTGGRHRRHRVRDERILVGVARSRSPRPSHGHPCRSPARQSHRSLFSPVSFSSAARPLGPGPSTRPVGAADLGRSSSRAGPRAASSGSSPAGRRRRRRAPRSRVRRHAGSHESGIDVQAQRYRGIQRQDPPRSHRLPARAARACR